MLWSEGKQRSLEFRMSIKSERRREIQERRAQLPALKDAAKAFQEQVGPQTLEMTLWYSRTKSIIRQFEVNSNMFRGQSKRGTK